MWRAAMVMLCVAGALFSRREKTARALHWPNGALPNDGSPLPVLA